MKGTGDFQKEEFSPEELAALGEAVPEGEGGNDGATGKSPEELEAEAQAKAAADAQAQAEADAKLAAEGASKTEKEVEKTELTAEEKVKVEEEGVKLIKDEKTGKQYLVDEDGTKIPVERWRKNFAKTHSAATEAQREAEETKHKLNLFKQLGADKYYEIYPQEKPADFQPTSKPAPTKKLDIDDFRTVTVQGGEYDGLTLGEVAKEDPLAAQVILNNHLNAIAAEEAKVEAEKAAVIRDTQLEQEAFVVSLAKQKFGKSGQVTDYTPEEQAEIAREYNALTAWMAQNNKIIYRLEDAYRIMNHDKIIHSEKLKAAEAALKDATKNKIPAIGGGDGMTHITGYEAYLKMSSDALAGVIDKMTDADQRTFYAKAPKELKEKYPSLPW